MTQERTFEEFQKAMEKANFELADLKESFIIDRKNQR